MKRTLALAALMGTVSAPVFAGSADQGMVEPAPMAPVAVAPAAPVTGDWTGFSLGAQLGYADIETEDPELDGDNTTYGVRGYYDYDFGQFVMGGGLQYDATDIDLDGAATVDGVMRAGVRGGYDAGQTFIYGTTGYAKAFTNDDGVDPGDANGYFIGAGLENKLTQNVSLSSELIYHEFNDFDDADDLEADATTFNVGLNYRF